MSQTTITLLAFSTPRFNFSSRNLWQCNTRFSDVCSM